MEYTFYKIQVGNECYVGSTSDYKNRLRGHKSSCCNEKDKHHEIKLYISIREIGWDNIDIMIIFKIIYNSKNEALDMETKYMLMFDAKLNSCYPKRSRKVYMLENKEKVSNYHKLYNEKHKEKRKNYSKEYYEKHKEERSKKDKITREKNIDKIREYDRKRSAFKLASKRLLSIDETYFQ